MKLILIASVLAVGCANLPDVTADQCGNGVVERGEDCDSGPGCDHCSWTCPTGSECPDGYACGHDHLCHAPSGVFHRQQSSQFDFLEFGAVVSDVDGDGIGDVLGAGTNSMDVTYGDPSGVLSHQTVQVSPRLDSPGAFTLRPLGDGSSQVLFGTRDGIASFTSQSKQLLPYPFAGDLKRSFTSCNALLPVSQNGLGYVPIGAFGLDGHHLNALAVDPGGGLEFGILDVLSGACTFAPACGLTATTMPPPFVITDVYATTAATAGDPSEVVAISVADSPVVPFRGTCAMRAVILPGNTFHVEQLTPKLARPEPAMFARLTSATCPWLVLGGPAAVMGPAGIDAYGCTLATTESMLVGTASDLGPRGRIPLDKLPPGQLPASTGPDAIVFASLQPPIGSSAIYAVSVSGSVATAQAIYTAPTPWQLVTSVDLDGDGISEGIVASTFDIEILRRPSGAATFTPYVIPTTGIPDHFVIADLDADGHPDLAYTQRAGTIEQLQVAYGTSGLPLPATSVAEFSQVAALLPIDTPDSNDLLNTITDLAVVDRPDPGAPDLKLTVMHGSAQRTLTAFYDPRPAPQTSSFDGLVTGNFQPHPPSDPTLDVLAFELHPATMTIPEHATVWNIDGSSGAALAEMPGAFDPPELVGASSALAIDQGRFGPWSIGTRDVAIGIDLAGGVVTVDPVQQTVTACTTCGLPAYDAGMPTSKQLRGYFGANVTGGRELYVLYGVQDFRQQKGAVYTCQVSVSGVVTACADIVTEIPDLNGWECNDAASGPVTARGPFDAAPSGRGDDLLLLCHRNGDSVVWHVVHDAAGYHAIPVLSQPDANFMVAADVTGDGVLDLLLLGTANQFPIFHVYPQCESRDQSCRAANEAM